jgi:hypothetical protein
METKSAAVDEIIVAVGRKARLGGYGSKSLASRPIIRW